MVDQLRSVEEDVDELELLTRPGREEDLRNFLLLLHPADVAELLSNVDERTTIAILRHLDSERAAELLSELEPHEQEQLLKLIQPEEIAPIVGEMETDDVTDLIQELDPTTARRVLNTLPVAEREGVAELLKYDPESAGGIMQTELVSIPLNSTVGAATEAVREAADDIDIISVFVVDDTGRYAGHLALQDLVLSSPETPIERVMDPKVVEVSPDVDQEEVAKLFDRYSLVELGVIAGDGSQKLIGRITADDVHEVLVEEAEEDLLKVAGTAGEPEVIYSDNVWKVVGQRLPWLASTLVAMMIASWILNSAEMIFGKVVTLLTFVPIITGMSGNVGTQSAMIMIQGMAIGHIAPDNMFKGIFKDVIVSSIMAITCGLSVMIVVALWKNSLVLGACIGIALACSMTAAAVLGSVEPAILKRFGIDPAVAAGPLITSINDISGVVIYTLVSLAFINQLQ